MIPDEAVEAAATMLRAFIDVTPELANRLARTQLEAAAPHLMAPVLALAEQWHTQGEDDMAVSKTIQDEPIAMTLLTEGAAMVENARHIRNAVAQGFRPNAD